MKGNHLQGFLLMVSAALSLAVWPPALWAVDSRKLEIVYDMYADYKTEAFPDVDDISPQEAMALLSAGRVVFVDTREPAEMEVSTLPGAITQDEFLARPAAFTGKTPVVYCTISYRSGVFARDMALKGITVYNLTGGILAWALEGGKVVDASGETRRIHVYGDKWNYPPQGYEAVTFDLFHRLTN